MSEKESEEKAESGSDSPFSLSNDAVAQALDDLAASAPIDNTVLTPAPKQDKLAVIEAILKSTSMDSQQLKRAMTQIKWILEGE